MRCAAIDRYCLPTGPTAANLPHTTAAAQDGTDRETDGQTDRWTPDSFIDPALHSMQADNSVV